MNIKDLWFNEIKKDMKERYPDYTVLLILYTIKLDDNTINPFKSEPIIVEEDEINIKKMEEISKQKGFLFFNNTEEGYEYFGFNNKLICLNQED